MITRLRVKNFKALRDIEIELTPIHVLIGPNDSGKTSILDALAALCRSVDHNLAKAFQRLWKGSELVREGKFMRPVTIDVDFSDTGITGYAVDVCFAQDHSKTELALAEEIIRKGGELFRSNALGMLSSWLGCTRVKHQSENPSWTSPYLSELREVRRLLAGVHYYRLDPAFLSLPVAPDSERHFGMESNGFGLAMCLGEIRDSDPSLFTQLEERFTRIFPHIASIRWNAEMGYRVLERTHEVPLLGKARGEGLYFELRSGGWWVPASQASAGTLLVLAYLAILYLPQQARSRILLVEEPENGVHPKLLREVLAVLRELTDKPWHTQVVVTTHSPYVLDLFSPDQVTLCTMQSNAEVKTTRLSESPAVKRQIDVFTLGEIWTSEGDAAIAETEAPVEEHGE